MRKFKNPFLFSLAVLPISAIAAYFTVCYQLDLYGPETVEAILRQVGSKSTLIAVSTLQSTLLVFLCSFFGYILADKSGLWKPFRIEKKNLAPMLPLTVLFGAVFSLDYWVFGRLLPGVQEADAAGLTVHGVLAGVLYGGIIEEILLRLLVMSLLALVIGKLFFRAAEKGQLPAGVPAAANVLSSLLFAAGHLPATITLFGTLTPLILIRCFLLNGAAGLWFGYLYRKYGLAYSMLAHALFHIVADVIWIVLI